MARGLLRPPDPLPVSEWAARYFHVDKTSPSPGLYDTSTTPWINPILDEFPDPNLMQIVLKASARSSKTQPAIICLAWVIANDPGPAMWVTAAGDEVRTFAKSRLRDSFQHTAPVAGLLDELGRADDQAARFFSIGNSWTQMRLSGDALDKGADCHLEHDE